MFVMSIEKRVTTKAAVEQPGDWYVHAALPIPFTPVVGMSILMPKKPKIVELTKVIWIANTGIFWAETHPHVSWSEPDAPTEAALLVDLSCWTEAVAADDIVEARGRLIQKEIQKLKSTILQARKLPFDIRGG